MNVELPIWSPASFFYQLKNITRVFISSHKKTNGTKPFGKCPSRCLVLRQSTHTMFSTTGYGHAIDQN